MARTACLALVSALLASEAGAWLRSSSSSLQVREDPKPLMSTVESLRSMMCMARDDILAHEKCLTFMVETCKDKSSGRGDCSELSNTLVKTCETPGDESKAACSYAKRLGLTVTGAADEEWWKKEEPAKEVTDEKKEEKVSEVKFAPPSLLSAPSPAGAPWASPEGAPGPSLMFAPAPAAMVGDPTVPPPSGIMDKSVPEEPSLPPHSAVIMDKSVPEEGLPENGFSEHSSELVSHEDSETQTGDWGKEWPQSRETEGASKERICRKYPKTEWCKVFVTYRAQQKHHHHHMDQGGFAWRSGSAKSMPTVALVAMLAGATFL